MLFNSFAFIFLFFPLVLTVASRLRGPALLRWVTLSSFVFYAFAGHAWFLVPMLITTVLDFVLAPRIAAAASAGRKRALLLVSLTGNLGLLFYFKYSGLLLSTFGLRVFDVVLPAGISFYTFQTMSYVIDVYRGEARPQTDFWKFAGFVSFFPHLVAGPLTRHHQLIPGLDEIARDGVRPRWREGVFLFSLGLAKKVLLADSIADHIVDPLLDHAVAMDRAGAWLALFGFSLQIYFDFSGYSDMAIGLARLFGIELPQNFNSPYQALDPSDFWRRWHMTLSSWLRDYLYIPLGGSRCSPARTDFNLMATMVLGGLWHGANWTFALWGFYHGMLLMAHHRLRERWSAWPAVVQRGVTFLAICLGWVFFRAPDAAAARAWLALLAPGPGFLSSTIGFWTAKKLVFLAGGLAIVQCPPNASSYRGYERIDWRGQVALGALAARAVLAISATSRFLYFQF